MEMVHLHLRCTISTEWSPLAIRPDLGGDIDLAVANEFSNSVSVLLNLSDTTVSAPGLAGDFDRDNEVGLSDSVPFLDVFRTTTGSSNWDPTFDLDGNVAVGLSDSVTFLE